jgi:hypothetical protein
VKVMRYGGKGHCSAKGGVLLGVFVLMLSACSSSKPNAPQSSSAPSDSCAALVGSPVSADAQCAIPVTGLTTPSAFPCYAQPGKNFYYFRDGDRYVYGMLGGVWKQMQYEQSLGPISNDLGC